MQTQHYLTDRKDITRGLSASLEQDLQLDDGEVLIAPQYFALTANNITYGATGDFLGYFKFFPVSDTQLAADGYVHVPVWGFAKVVESRSDALPKGTLFYGFLPMASHMKMTPGRISPAGFRDEAAHRKDLPAVYNQYLFTSDDATTGAWRSLLNPLFATSWMLADYLEANDWFKADQVIVSSASSKTAFGLTRLLSQLPGKPLSVVGLTSSGNKDFVSSLDSCDSVVLYDDLERDIKKAASVYIDLGGDTALRSRLHAHLGDDLQHSCAVGTSHWDSFNPAEQPQHGPKPQFFFAPSHVKMRRQEWGPGVIEGKMEDGWQALRDWAKDHLALEDHQGFDTIDAVWQALATGKSDAWTGHIIRL